MSGDLHVKQVGPPRMSRTQCYARERPVSHAMLLAPPYNNRITTSAMRRSAPGLCRIHAGRTSAVCRV